MTGSRKSSALPQSTCTPPWLEKAHNHTRIPRAADLPASAEVCIGPVRRQDRSSSLRCGRCVLTPALNRCRPHGGRKSAKSQVGNALTEPHPFRDDYIQAVVTRQSAASASVKGWLLPVVTALFGFALTQHVWLLALLGMFLIAVFAYIDANYLRSEKAYRTLYNAVSRSERSVPRFTLDPTDAYEPPCGNAPARTKRKALRDKYLPQREVWTSWSIAPFYSAMLLLGVGVAVTAAFTADKAATPPPHGPTTTTTVVSTVPVSSPPPVPAQPPLPPP